MSEQSREDQVISLLRVRDEWADRPKLGRTFRAAAPGEQATEWFVCPGCRGHEQAKRNCSRCGGAGRVRGDAMTVEAKQEWFQDEDRHARRRLVEREIRRLDLAELHRRGEVGESEREDWERAKEAIYRSWSVAELEAAVAELPAFHRAVLELVYGYEAPLRTVSVALQQSADLAVRLVAQRMPEEIRAPVVEVLGTGRFANGHARQQRDAQIRALASNGLRQSEIAARIGVDQSTVSRVLAQRAAA